MIKYLHILSENFPKQFKTISIILFTMIFSSAFGQNPELKDSILKKFEQLKEEKKVNALVAGIFRDDKEILMTALGESMTSVPASTDMKLRIGGVSETFLGTLLMILVDKGIVRLDEKISNWLPDLLKSDQVTIGMLMKNTAGYKDYVLNEDFVKLITKEPFRNFTRDEIISYSTESGELNFPPGTDQKYSHTEFTILGKALEIATGKKMAELYKEYIFKPLNLENTGYSFNAELPDPVLHAYSSDRGVYEDATFWNPSWTGDSGPLYSTIPDICKWSGIFGTGKLLSVDSFKEFIKKPEGAKNPELYFASGFINANGWYAQNPSFNGYSGAFGYLPEEKLTIVIYTTQSEDPDSGAQAFQIFKEIVKMLTPENTINF